MENLRNGQRVWAEGLQGTFTIVRIDENHGVVDLELTAGNHFIQENVPLDTIHALGQEFSKLPVRKSTC